MDSQLINLACASDDSYAQHLTVMLCSCLFNFSKENFLEVFVLDGGISPGKKEIIKNVFLNYKNSKITFLSMNSDNYKGYKKHSFISEASYYRIDLPNILHHIDKIIFMDCDIIVLGDISEIWNRDLKGNVIIAAQDGILMKSTYDIFFKVNYEIDYFNSGVMLIDLQKMRVENISQKAIDFIKENNDKLFDCDMLPLNFALLNRWGKISSQWNFDTGLQLSHNYLNTTLPKEDFYLAREQPKLLHYTTRFFKPWLYESTGKYKKYYYEYLDKTDYKGWRPVFSIRTLIKKIVYYIYFYLLSKKIRDYIYNNFKFLRG